ncbi:MAG: hypothetical protein ACR2LQ_06435 [Acidimicrobiales bacterium]
MGPTLAAMLWFVSAGCGGGALIPHVSAEAKAALQPDLVAIRTAASAGDRGGVQQAVASLRQHVEQLQTSRLLADANAREIDNAAEAVIAQLGDGLASTTSPPPPTSEPTSATAPPTTSPPPGHGKGKDNGKDGG